ncbi:recombinase family protein [Runella slithyformis]
MSLSQIVEHLNNNGITTSTGRKFYKTSISRLV